MFGNDVGNPVRILVAEDSDINRSMLVKQLKFIGYGAIAVSDGQQAVEFCQSHPVDVVMMDCLMPTMDGYQATRMIRQIFKSSHNSPIIIGLTARALQGDHQKCLAAGMDDYLAKPAFAKDLKVMLNKWIQQPIAV